MPPIVFGTLLNYIKNVSMSNPNLFFVTMFEKQALS